jgi:hypothetical protein
MGINKFSDMTDYEFSKMKGGLFDPEQYELAETLEFNETEPVANGVDWRNSGAVTAVKD